MDLFFLAFFLFFGKERHAHIVRLPQAFHKHLIDIGLYFHLLVTCFTCFHNFTFYLIPLFNSATVPAMP